VVQTDLIPLSLDAEIVSVRIDPISCRLGGLSADFPRACILGQVIYPPDFSGGIL
jgi:hypothetical protein